MQIVDVVVALIQIEGAGAIAIGVVPQRAQRMLGIVHEECPLASFALPGAVADCVPVVCTNVAQELRRCTIFFRGVGVDQVQVDQALKVNEAFELREVRRANVLVLDERPEIAPSIAVAIGGVPCVAFVAIAVLDDVVVRLAATKVGRRVLFGDSFLAQMQTPVVAVHVQVVVLAAGVRLAQRCLGVA